MARRRQVVCALMAVPVVVVSAVPRLQFDHWPWICLALAVPVVGWGGLPLHRDALGALRHGRTSDDVPALLGIACALAGSVVLLLTGPAGDPGWTQAFPPAPGLPRLDVAAGVTLALLLVDARHPGSRRRVVPAVLAVAAGTLGYRLGAGDDVWSSASATVAVLLVAAPAALRPRRDGRVERQVDTVLFTSRTLTRGARGLDAVHVTGDTDPDEALRLAGSVCEPSTHPVARAIAVAAAAQGDVPAVGEFDDRPGLGACGIVAELRPGADGPAGRRADGTAVAVVAHAVLAGHPDLLAEHDIELPDDLAAARDEGDRAGHTTVALAWDGRARAVLTVATDVPDAGAAAVTAARRAGLDPAWMSARPAPAATAVALRAGIDTVLSGVRPDGEAAAVAQLRGQGRTVAVVGEAGRDDGALAAADLPLAVEPAAGSTSPAHPDAAAAVAALRRRRRRPGRAQWVTAAAVGYHLVALPAAASGMIDPLLAGLLGALVTAVSTRRSDAGA